MKAATKLILFNASVMAMNTASVVFFSLNIYLYIALMILNGGTILGVLALERKNKPKALVYGDRWKNHKYVNMIHDTIRLEAEVGEVTTECGCPSHTLRKVQPREIDHIRYEPSEVYISERSSSFRILSADRNVKDHVMFFPSGPKSMTNEEVNQYLRKIRDMERKHREEAMK